MEKLNTQDICCDCQLGIDIMKCRECLFNVFKAMDKYAPFGGDEDNSKESSKELKKSE